MPFISSFITADPDSPEGKIFYAFKTSMQFISMVDFNARALGNILKNVTDLSVAQRLAVKLVASNYPKDNFDTSLNSILMYVLYGSFEKFGIDEDEVALSVSQREAILFQIYYTAIEIINEKVMELCEVRDWDYEKPDWKIFPDPDPDPEPTYGYGYEYGYEDSQYGYHYGYGFGNSDFFDVFGVGSDT